MIRRVISEPDEMDAMSVSYENAGGLLVDADEGNEDSPMIGKEEETNQYRGESSSNSPPAGAVAPAFVEPDTMGMALHRQHHHHQIDAPLSVIDPPLMRRNNDSSSTLSIDQDDDDEPLVQLEQRQHNPPVVRALARTNSRSSSNSSQVAKSSQNSSRDWGWFEEIHFSDRGKKVAGDDDDEKKPSATGEEDVGGYWFNWVPPSYVCRF